RPFQASAWNPLVILGVELSEALAVLADEVSLARPDRSALNPGEPFDRIAVPVRLAELPVADEVDPDCGLLPNHVGHRAPEAFLERRFVVRPTFEQRLEIGDERGWRDEPAHVVRENPVGSHVASLVESRPRAR